MVPLLALSAAAAERPFCNNTNLHTNDSSCTFVREPSYSQYPVLSPSLTSVTFSTTDTYTQLLVDHAAKCEAANLLELVRVRIANSRMRF